jgi:hypothetical protein
MATGSVLRGLLLLLAAATAPSPGAATGCGCRDWAGSDCADCSAELVAQAMRAASASDTAVQQHGCMRLSNILFDSGRTQTFSGRVAVDGVDGAHLAERGTATDAGRSQYCRQLKSELERPAPPNPCLSSIDCGAHGSCSVDGVCACEAGFAGETCSDDIDECASRPCANDATCTQHVDSFACSCEAGYSGDACEVDVDECASSPCANGGACTDGADDYTCSCAAGFEGDTCAEDIDECASSPCLNSGICSDSVDSFTCSCTAGFEGETCGTVHVEAAWPQGHGSLVPFLCGMGAMALLCASLAGVYFYREYRYTRVRNANVAASERPRIDSKAALLASAV